MASRPVVARLAGGSTRQQHLLHATDGSCRFLFNRCRCSFPYATLQHGSGVAGQRYVAHREACGLDTYTLTNDTLVANKRHFKCIHPFRHGLDGKHAVEVGSGTLDHFVILLQDNVDERQRLFGLGVNDGALQATLGNLLMRAVYWRTDFNLRHLALCIGSKRKAQCQSGDGGHFAQTQAVGKGRLQLAQLPLAARAGAGTGTVICTLRYLERNVVLVRNTATDCFQLLANILTSVHFSWGYSVLQPSHRRPRHIPPSSGANGDCPILRWLCIPPSGFQAP